MTVQIATAQLALAQFAKDSNDIVAASKMLDTLGIEHSLSTSDYLAEMSDNQKIMDAVVAEFGRDGDDCNTLLTAVRECPVSFWRTVKSALS